MIRYRAEWLADFYRAVFLKLGLGAEQAQCAADGLLYADLRGIDTHGAANLVRIYVTKLRAGKIDARATPEIIPGAASGAVVDGRNAIGFATGLTAVNEAVRLAEARGMSTVAVRGATHCGSIGFYVQSALRKGMLCTASTNLGSQRMVAAPGGTPLVGTNVVAFGVPAGKMPSFLLDMSTSATSAGRIRRAAALGEKVPEAWLFDREARSITDAAAMDRGDAFLAPLGGRDAWHKGFGLALWSELMTSCLSGANSAPVGAVSGAQSVDDNIGLAFMVMSPEVVVPRAVFEERVDRVLEAVLAAGTSYAGHVEHTTMRERLAHGVPVMPELVHQWRALAEELSIRVDW